MATGGVAAQTSIEDLRRVKLLQGLSDAELARIASVCVWSRHRAAVHPRSIERALARKKTLGPGPCANAAATEEDADHDIECYEHLRGAVLKAQARPEGLAAVAYHGLIGGLKLIASMAEPTPTAEVLPVPITPDVTEALMPIDPALVRLLANMVLLFRQEVSHVI